MEGGKFNLRNPAVKRILQEIKEVQQDPTSDYMAAALEDNIFEWHFAVRGPSDTEFQGGIYHGRILLPPEYPFKPPSFLMLSPNGRFETGVKICLSISSHHPEHWQPSWSVRTALTALIAFFPTPGNGAIGSLEYSKEERAALAVKSRASPPHFGSPERQKVIDELHADMLAAEARQVPSAVPGAAAPKEEGAVLAVVNTNAGSPNTSGAQAPPCQTEEGRSASMQAPIMGATLQAPKGLEREAAAPPASAAAQAPPLMSEAGASSPVASRLRMLQHLQQRNTVTTTLQTDSGAGRVIRGTGGTLADWHTWEDRGLTVVAGVLVALIAALVFRRMLIVGGVDVTSLM